MAALAWLASADVVAVAAAVASVVLTFVTYIWQRARLMSRQSQLGQMHSVTVKLENGTSVTVTGADPHAVAHSVEMAVEAQFASEQGGQAGESAPKP